jgi:hypothetical protein
MLLTKIAAIILRIIRNSQIYFVIKMKSVHFEVLRAVVMKSSLPGYNAVQSAETQLTFRRNM